MNQTEFPPQLPKHNADLRKAHFDIGESQHKDEWTSYYKTIHVDPLMSSSKMGLDPSRIKDLKAHHFELGIYKNLDC